MEITREKMHTKFEELVDSLFMLPEAYAIKSKDIVIQKGDKKENIQSKIWDIMEKNYHDFYSDIDFHVEVRLSSKGKVDIDTYMSGISRYHFNSDTCLGIVFIPENYLYRIVTREGMRYDMGLDISMDERAPVLDSDFFGDGQGHIGIKPLSLEEKEADRFWFVQVQALGKLYRNDFLISDHLANMNLNETLVLQMQIRDIQYGTNHHRYGYSEELEYRSCLQDLQKYPDKCPYHGTHPVFDDIAVKLLAAGDAYDKLAGQIRENYRERSSIFREIWASYDCVKGMS